jgi:alpha-galactosidase
MNASPQPVASTTSTVKPGTRPELPSAVCTLKEIREMTSEMLEAERKWLPQFAGKKVSPKPAVRIPAGTKAIDLAQDPAQAILKRFMDLAADKK